MERLLKNSTIIAGLGAALLATAPVAAHVKPDVIANKREHITANPVKWDKNGRPQCGRARLRQAAVVARLRDQGYFGIRILRYRSATVSVPYIMNPSRAQHHCTGGYLVTIVKRRSDGQTLYMYVSAHTGKPIYIKALYS